MFDIMASFGVICGVLSIITGFLCCKKVVYSCILAIINTIIFICAFTTTLQRMRFNRQCKEYFLLVPYDKVIEFQYGDLGYCDKGGMGQMSYPYEVFWGSSITCLISNIFHIICTLAILYEENFPVKVKKENHPVIAPPTQVPIVQPEVKIDQVEEKKEEIIEEIKKEEIPQDDEPPEEKNDTFIVQIKDHIELAQQPELNWDQA